MTGTVDTGTVADTDRGVVTDASCVATVRRTLRQRRPAIQWPASTPRRPSDSLRTRPSLEYRDARWHRHGSQSPRSERIRIRIRLLGPVTVDVDGAPLAVDTRKAVALLAWLAVTRRPMSREAVAALLWPEADDVDARGALRRTLSVLRAGLGQPGLIVDRSAVALELAAFDVDLWRFEAALAVARAHRHPGDGLCDACRDALETAVALDRGDFMAGFALRDSEEFDCLAAGGGGGIPARTGGRPRAPGPRSGRCPIVGPGRLDGTALAGARSAPRARPSPADGGPRPCRRAGRRPRPVSGLRPNPRSRTGGRAADPDHRSRRGHPGGRPCQPGRGPVCGAPCDPRPAWAKPGTALRRTPRTGAPGDPGRSRPRASRAAANARPRGSRRPAPGHRRGAGHRQDPPRDGGRRRRPGERERRSRGPRLRRGDGHSAQRHRRAAAVRAQPSGCARSGWRPSTRPRSARSLACCRFRACGRWRLPWTPTRSAGSACSPRWRRS